MTVNTLQYQTILGQNFLVLSEQPLAIEKAELENSAKPDSRGVRRLVANLYDLGRVQNYSEGLLKDRMTHGATEIPVTPETHTAEIRFIAFDKKTPFRLSFTYSEETVIAAVQFHFRTEEEAGAAAKGMGFEVQ